MPVANRQSDIDVIKYVCDEINTRNFQNQMEADPSDIQFLTNYLRESRIEALVRAKESLDAGYDEAVSCDNIGLLQQIRQSLRLTPTPGADELYNILSDPHIKALMEAHDDVTSKNFFALPDDYTALTSALALDPNNVGPSDTIKMVSIRKLPNEPLGILVKKEGEDLVIARILNGSMIDRQGMLHVGDVICEINGQEVHDPDDLRDLLIKYNGTATLKVLPGFQEFTHNSKVFFKTHFSYNPQGDNLIPCREAGMSFRAGEILQVVNMDDAWWQAIRTDGTGESGLIPSQALEEKRKAFVPPENDLTHKSLLCGIMTKKKRTVMFQSGRSDFDRHDLIIYEEVTPLPPFKRNTLVLIGAQGVGRRTLKNKLIRSDQSRFGTIVPHTSREMKEGEVNGNAYYFMDREQMENEINRNHFVEWGELDGILYGTKLSSIRNVIKSGRMCVVDLNPAALKIIKTAEFMPFVVFVAAPPVDIMRNMQQYAIQKGRSVKIRNEKQFRDCLEESKRIEEKYRHHFDLVIINDNMDEAFAKLRNAINDLGAKDQWVPVGWVY